MKPAILWKAHIWIPTAFCGFISAMHFDLERKLPGEDNTFIYSFLWLCFFFVALVHLALDKRIKILEAALRDRSGQTTSSTDA